MLKSKVAVFLGPSLDVKEAKELLYADYFPPAAPGDLLRVANMGFETILLVDGSCRFGGPRHKEILYALDKGISVLGASAMGAVRAAELSDYGMLGVGWSYEYFLAKKPFLDSDEIMCLYDEDTYARGNETLLNIRYNLELQNLEDTEWVGQLKQSFYGYRNIQHFPQLKERDWLRQDLHAQDTRIALSIVAKQQQQVSKSVNWIFPKTLFFYRDLVYTQTNPQRKISASPNLHLLHRFVSSLLRVAVEFNASQLNNLNIEICFTDLEKKLTSLEAESIGELESCIASLFHPMGKFVLNLKAKPEHLSSVDRLSLLFIERAARLCCFIETNAQLMERLPEKRMQSAKMEVIKTISFLNSKENTRKLIRGKGGMTAYEQLLSRLKPISILLEDLQQQQCVVSKEFRFNHVDWSRYSLNLCQKDMSLSDATP